MYGPFRSPLSAARGAGAIFAVALTLLLASSAGAADWQTGGQNLQNTRFQAAETAIGAANAGTLTERWRFTTGGDVSATPTIDGDLMFFPDSAGNLFAVNRTTGAQVWRARIAEATGITGDYARAAAAVSGRTVIIGTQSGKFENEQTSAALRGAYILGYDRATGALRWKTKIDDHFSAFVTQSAQVYKGVAYVGVASNEEAYSNRDLSGTPYACCSFRGSVAALDAATGAIKWKTYTLPAEPGYSGAAVWGSTPAIDQTRGALYISTGNNYSLPSSRVACLDTATGETAKRACLAGDHFDAIVSLDLASGAIKWSRETLPYDAWNTDCGLPGFSPGGTNEPSNCPAQAGPDYDFGQAPMLFKTNAGKVKRDVVGGGAKSGVFWALDRDTGETVWSTQVGPGGLLGGLQWGSATDGKRVYVAESNSTELKRGWWSALDVTTGAVLWKTFDPGVGFEASFGIYGYSAQGPVSTANGVVYGCSLDPAGNMVAMDAATGAIKWQYASGSSCIGGAAIADGTVYWGTGYRAFAPLSTAGNKLFAFGPGS